MCKNDILINTIKKSSQNPKITVIIPVYNAAKTIKATIKSIQNQNMSDIEIILIDDCSEDNSIIIIQELQTEDSRIKLLKSKKNKGTLYTRSIGALNSKGKYIMTINNDDLFINNIFHSVYEEAELNNLDILEFSYYNAYNIDLSPQNSSFFIPHHL
jgi:glycosyltransferase involved in cell wall biosynthesis